MSAKTKFLWLGALLVLTALILVWSPGWGKASYKGRSVSYWFRQNLKAAHATPQTEAERERISGQVNDSLEAIKAMGTNAFPYLFKQAFRIADNSSVQRGFYRMLQALPQSWGLPKFTSEEEISHQAIEVIYHCGPTVPQIFPLLLGPLNGTNTEQHLRALDILQGALGPSDQAMPCLIRDLSSPNARISAAAQMVFLRDRSKAKTALPALVDVLKKAGPNEYTNQNVWLSKYSWLIGACNQLGTNTAILAPVLEETFIQATNWETRSRCWLAQALVNFDPHRKQIVVPVMAPAFEIETNWDVRCRLAKMLFSVDPGQTNALNFLTDAWETVSDIGQRREVWSALSELFQTNLPPPEVPLAELRYRPPPFERWLALGQGTSEPLRNPTVAEWLSLAGGNQPHYEGVSLKRWLEGRLGPTSSTQFSSAQAVPWERCENAVRSIGTNALPWLILWLESTNADQYILARRGFLFLQKDGLVALPALTELIQTNSDFVRRAGYGCMRALHPSWTDAWRQMVPALHNPDLSIRMEAAAYLYQNFQQEALIEGLKDFVSPLILRSTETNIIR